MSDIQQYLLDYDRNKKEATETAQRSATREFCLVGRCEVGSNCADSEQDSKMGN